MNDHAHGPITLAQHNWICTYAHKIGVRAITRRAYWTPINRFTRS